LLTWSRWLPRFKLTPPRTNKLNNSFPNASQGDVFPKKCNCSAVPI
jgi:hypothetical protein